MAKIHLLTPEPCADEHCLELVQHYMRLLKPQLGVEFKHYGGEKVSKPTPGNIQQALLREAGRIENLLPVQGQIFLLSEKGVCHETLVLFPLFQQWLQQAAKLSFVFGGAYGLHESLYKPGRTIFALSPMTLPHELSLVVWIEQLYRLSTLMSAKRYHY